MAIFNRDFEVKNTIFIYFFQRLKTVDFYSVFPRFRQAKFANGGLILSSGQFSLLPQAASKNKTHSESGQN
jgi:hypothetical protein